MLIVYCNYPVNEYVQYIAHFWQQDDWFAFILSVLQWLC